MITTAEARVLGISKNDLRELAQQRRVRHPHSCVWVQVHHREHPGLVAGAAALAAGGPRSALSHGSAAWVWQMLDQPPATPSLLVPHGTHRQITGVDLHRARSPFVFRSQQGLRLTDPIRTLIDVANQSPNLLTVAVDRTLMKQLIRFADLAAATDPATRTRRRGVVALRAHLETLGYLGAPAPSVLESQMTRLLLASGLPAPIAEYVAGEGGGYRLDFAWPHLRLAVEVDGYAWHHSPEQLAADNARRNHLQGQGWRLIVFTWTQIRDDPDGVIAQILRAYHELAA